MVYIIAGATGVVGSAISKELAKENEVHLIGRDEDKLSALSKEIDAQYSLIDLTDTTEQREFSKIIPELNVFEQIKSTSTFLKLLEIVSKTPFHQSAPLTVI